MFALRIEYLTGRCVATSYNDRSSVEWPPHPARVFYALVSAWAGADEPDDVERRALEWLAAQPAPSLCVDRTGGGRSVVTHYVPVNDTAVLATKFGSLEEKLAQAHAAEDDSAAVLAQPADAKQQRQAQATLEKARKQIDALSRQLEMRKKADQNDSSGASTHMEKRAVGLLPEGRVRQPRTFPSRALAEPTMYLVWPASATDDIASAVDAVARRVTHVGHSSSLVTCRVAPDAPEPALVPDDSGDVVLRIASPGLVQRLVDAHARHNQIEPRVMPCAFQAYARPSLQAVTDIASSTFGDDWTVFRQIDGPRLSSTLAADVAGAFRAALMSHADEPIAEALSGHAADGSPSTQPHAAFVPLPYVGHRHATGALLGIALVLPRDLGDAERRAVLRAVGRWEAASRREIDDFEVDAPPLRLRLGNRGVLELERVVWGTAPQATLRPVNWARPSRRWLSVTPVALDRNPGNLFADDPAGSARAFLEASNTIGIACERIGLPRPVRVDVLPSVTMPGVSKARDFSAFPADRRKPQRVKVHAVLEFDTPVRGPVLLGAGRFLGLGLFRPIVDVPDREDHR